MANVTFNNSTSHGRKLSFLKLFFYYYSSHERLKSKREREKDREVMRYDCHRKSRKL